MDLVSQIETNFLKKQGKKVKSPQITKWNNRIYGGQNSQKLFTRLRWEGDFEMERPALRVL